MVYLARIRECFLFFFLAFIVFFDSFADHACFFFRYGHLFPDF